MIRFSLPPPPPPPPYAFLLVVSGDHRKIVPCYGTRSLETRRNLKLGDTSGGSAGHARTGQVWSWQKPSD